MDSNELNERIEKMASSKTFDYIEAFEILKENKNDIELFRNKIFPVIKLFVPKMVYKYCSFGDNLELNNLKLKTLSDNKVFLSHHSNMNDPFDSKGLYYDNLKLAKEVDRLKDCNGLIIEDFAKDMVMTCFTANDFNCLPMWAHYSNNHNGYCVSYDTDIPENHMLFSTIVPIQYIGNRIDMTEYMIDYFTKLEKLVDKNIEKGITTHIIRDYGMVFISLFFTCLKQNKWSYENEYRVSVGKTQGNDYLEAKPKAIYIGMNCSSEYEEKLMGIADFNDIEIFKMKPNNHTTSYELIPMPME